MPNHETMPGDNPNINNPSSDNPWNNLTTPEPVENPDAQPQSQQAHEALALKVASKLLTNSSFDKRHAEVVDSSLNKAKRAGEKLTGSGSERRNKAYLHRIEDMVDQLGSRMEKNLLRASVDRIITQPEDIPDSYWAAQEQILRDNGQARELSDREKEILTADIQRQQRESLKPWVDYLSHEDCPFPTWFKVYAFDGMSRMTTFDKEKRTFHKRDASSVAPFPHLDAAVLGKTYDAIADFYNLDQADFANQPADSETSADRDAELEALVRSGNFNKLYSKFLLEKRVILKTPERAEDVHGAWREYFPGDEEALAHAADGTPWCVASPAVGKNYLETGSYGNGYYNNPAKGNKAKFILFHLQDPETGMLAENACASIRLDTNGRVAEISGLNNGQVLEDALVPEVEAKVRTLPGGERFLEAFADKQHLIAMDRKMQAGEYDFSQEDLEFIFEQKREIARLNTFGSDPRIEELQRYILQDKHFSEHHPEIVNGDEDLCLSYTNITELPAISSIGGDLDLEGTSISRLPDGLSVGGDLYLGWSDIAQLPEGLTVGGDLDLGNTKNITEIPKGVKVAGNLNLKNSSVVEIKERLVVGGTLDFSSESRDTADYHYEVIEKKDLSREEFLESYEYDFIQLPEELIVGENLELINMMISDLPKSLHVGGNLSLRGTAIAKLPEDFSVGGDLNLAFSGITEIPEGLHVNGNLDLYDTEITSLPGRLNVEGDLDLRDTHITELPEGLHVGGDLYLRHFNVFDMPKGLSLGGKLYINGVEVAQSPEDPFVIGNFDLSYANVARLPEDLSVSGNFSLYQANIAKLPENLNVDGDLDLRGTKISELPDGLRVGGSLNLIGGSITRLPEGLSMVRGDLYLDYSRIAELPNGLSVHGNLGLNSTNIARLPEGLTVNGKFNLMDANIGEFPEDLTVNGDLDLSMANIAKVSKSLHVGGDLRLFKTNILELPEDLTVGGDFLLPKSNITQLPERLVVGGTLILRDSAIAKLPEGLRVGKNLNISGTKVVALPEDLSVGGSLNISGTKITALPENLSVGGDLDLRGTDITELPEGLDVGGDLILLDTAITELPESVRVSGKIIRTVEEAKERWVELRGLSR